MNGDLKDLFESWGKAAKKDYVDQQWLLSKWEVVEGVIWPGEKIDLMVSTINNGLELKSSDLLADLGCGGGWILKRLKPSVRDVVGLDFSLSMLNKAKSFYPSGNFVCGEIGKLPFKDQSVEKALSYFVFLNFMDDRFVEQAMRDVFRVIKKGGRALIGQLPDKTMSSVYDRERDTYWTYCRRTFQLGESHRDICRAPQKLFDKQKLEKFLDNEKINYEFRPSFNPFYRKGEAKTIDWRFDLVMKK